VNWKGGEGDGKGEGRGRKGQGLVGKGKVGRKGYRDGMMGTGTSLGMGMGYRDGEWE
jgi:hypothetical protein